MRAADTPATVPAAPAPSVAVVITYYCNQAYIAEAVDSVLRQTHPPNDVVLIDDASPETLEVPVSWGDRVRVLRHDTNRGAGAARQTGVRATTTEWIAFLDADDVWDVHKLERQLADIRARPDLDVHHTGLVSVYHDGREVPWLDKPKLLMVAEQLKRNQALPSATMMRRSALERVGGWSADRSVMEDWELGIRLVSAGANVGFLAEPLVRFRRELHGNLSSRGFRHMWANLGTIRAHLGQYRAVLGLPGTLAVVGRVMHDEGCRRGGIDGAMLRGVARLVALGALP